MDSDIGPLTPEALLEHDSFVRAVARGLLGDAEASADVAQETWMRAFAGGPRERGALRGWLSRVAGNLARDRRRSTARRALREERAARNEAQESVAAAFERLSLQRDVVGAILALDEPYRGVILLRYFHELEPQVIAERLGRKPATVRTQLVRAHELLRTKLDSRYGRETWAALLLPLGLAAPSVRTGNLPVIGLGLGAVAAVAIVWMRATDEREPRPAPVLAAKPLDVTPIEPAIPTPLDAENQRSRSDLALATPTPAPDQPVTRHFLGPRAELYARNRYGDPELATFDFEAGLRGDRAPLAESDGDIHFAGQRFEKFKHGVLVDLGELPLRELWSWRGTLGPAVERAEARRGHTYFLWSRVGETDLAAAFEVLELVPEERCTLEWCATSDGASARASFGDEGTAARLARRLIELRGELRRPRELVAPRVQLQVRGGDQRGNDYRVDMAGGLRHVGELSPLPLDLRAPIDSRQAAYCVGGFVPEGKVLVVTRATYRVAALEDADQPGALVLVIGGQRVVEVERGEIERGERPFSGTWSGRIEVPPGQETQTYLELRNASVGEAELFGEWVERPGVVAHVRPAPPRRPREPGPELEPLREPRARLQARCEGTEDVTFCVRLDGSMSRLGARSEAPLVLDAPEPSERGVVAFCEGGTVPPGLVFVVTRVDYRGYARADGKGRIGFAVVIGGERIVEHRVAGELADTWHGRVEIPQGDEKLTRLEVSNASAAEAILYGEFIGSR